VVRSQPRLIYRATLTGSTWLSNALPLDGAAEVLSWLGDLIERLLCEADHIFRAQPGQGRT